MASSNDCVRLLTHDTVLIIDASPAALHLFCCEIDMLVGRELVDLLASDEFKGLALLRMRLLRQYGRIPPVRYPFRRFDEAESVFWADVTTTKIDNETYESIITDVREG